MKIDDIDLANFTLDSVLKFSLIIKVNAIVLLKFFEVIVVLLRSYVTFFG
jgi:hypothetical protein